MADLIKKLLAWLADLLRRKPTQNEPVIDIPPPKASPPGDLRLSPHFLLSEFTRSATAQAQGLENRPGPEHYANLRQLAATLERIRSALGDNPILISSGYRSPALNRAVGGSATSDHANGLAVDFTCPGYGSVHEVCEAIRDSGIPFDQLIYEQGATDWVHLGIGTRMRRQVMSWAPDHGYVTGIRRLK